jgi:hypothetical protein
MAYEIKEETRKQTKCPYNFECLNNDDWNTCSIDSALIESGLIIRDKCKKNYCPHLKKFGYSYFFCYCPSRREIYQSYRI